MSEDISKYTKGITTVHSLNAIRVCFVDHRTLLQYINKTTIKSP